MDRIVGIDLGTSTSCLAVVVDGEPVVAPDSRGNRVTPSYIHVMEDGRILVGPQAKNEVISDPYSTIWATKRLIGRRFDDPEVQKARQYFGFDILKGPDGGIKVKGRDKELDPTEVGAIILKYLTRIGKKTIGQDIKRVVITVPAYFTDPQRKATREAGTMIGLDVVKLINEPTAAALAYGFDQDEEQTIAIFDLGGGTFDLSILAIGQGVFEVIATDGDSWLGGEDFDNRLVDFLVEDFKQKFQINIFNDKMAHQRVKDAAERTKIALSDKDEVEINLPAICPDLNRWAGIEAVITREQYEGMVRDLVEKPVIIFERLLKEIGMGRPDIDNLVMVGGMTRMPLVRRTVAEFYGREPDCSLHPDESVAVGAAIHAASISGEKLLRTRPERVAVGAPLPMAAPLPEATQPGIGQDATRPGASYDQSLTTPGFPVAQPVVEPKAPAPPPPGMAPPPAPAPPRRAPDYHAETLPLEKNADTRLPMDRDRASAMPPTPETPEAPLAEVVETGDEWSGEEAELPEPLEAEAVSEEVTEELVAPDEETYAPASHSVAAADAAPSGLDEFFMPPSSPSPPEPPPTVTGLAPAPREWVERVQPAQTVETPFERDSLEQEAPVELAAADEAPAPLEMPVEEAAGGEIFDQEPAEFEGAGDELPAVEEPEPPQPSGPPAAAEGGHFDDHPVAAGPIIRDLGAPPAPPPASAEKAAARGMVDAPVLLDVLSQTVGIAHFGGHFVPIVRRFSKLPARATQIFTTCTDNQDRIRITVMQGEGLYAKENTPLGEFVLDGIEKARRGRPEIEVRFDIDQSGLFTVSASDKHTGAAKEIKLDNWAGGRAPEAEMGQTK